MRVRGWKIYSVAVLLVCVVMHARAEQQYLCELGVQGGCGYYAGDATPHIFMNVREAYGLHFRYKFTPRWALQVKASSQRITGDDYTIRGEVMDTRWENRLVNVDVMAEFNFFRIGVGDHYDKATHPYSPYIFIGLGAGLYGANMENKPTFQNMAAYIPLGIGFKWKFHDWCGLNVAWQHNIYLADNLESRSTLADKHELNGNNIMNCDVTGMLTLGLVFEFMQAPKVCKTCYW